MLLIEQQDPIHECNHLWCMLCLLQPLNPPPFDGFHLRRPRKGRPNSVVQLVHWTRGRKRAIAQTWGELSDRPTMWPDKLPSGLVNVFMLLPIYCSHKIKIKWHRKPQLKIQILHSIHNLIPSRISHTKLPLPRCWSSLPPILLPLLQPFRARSS